MTTDIQQFIACVFAGFLEGWFVSWLVNKWRERGGSE